MKLLKQDYVLALREYVIWDVGIEYDFALSSLYRSRVLFLLRLPLSILTVNFNSDVAVTDSSLQQVVSLEVLD